VEKKILQSMTSDFYDFQISNLSLLIDWIFKISMSNPTYIEL
jgi:hypothetical protein